MNTQNEEQKKLKKASKFMSLLLRHQPELIKLELDDEGWARIEDLVNLTKGKTPELTASLIHKIVDTNDKQRFIISDDGVYIRANQGHSIDINLNLPPQEPPETLYHGTTVRFLESILREGLLKKTRQHVHLSADIATAKNVGQRHGKPAILLINAYRMHNDGHQFFLSENGVWLTDQVPPSYLTELDKPAVK